MFVTVTIDVDYINYLTGNQTDEISDIFSEFKELCFRNVFLKTTWFIRIDSQIEKLYGDPLYILKKHNKEINWLRENGHEIGWHHHCYKNVNGQWLQQIDEKEVINDLKKYGSLAVQNNMNICRMGWGYHTNETFTAVEQLGFIIDSSAIPRPNYKWDLSVKNWIGTPILPYYPSMNDYRIPGQSDRKTLQAPITTAILEWINDTDRDVIRYLNPAYKAEYFRKAYRQVNHIPFINLITHPYELCRKNNPDHDTLIEFDINCFEKNIVFVFETGGKFIRLSQLKEYMPVWHLDVKNN